MIDLLGSVRRATAALTTDCVLVFECRRCGTTVEADTEVCARCGTRSIVRYEIR